MKKICLPAMLIALFSFVHAQKVNFQGWYWDYPKTGDDVAASWADTLRTKAAQLKAAGFTHIWFPPHAIASSGDKSNGYDPKDLYIGNQKSGLGTRTALNNMLNEFKNQGIAPVADMIYNHRDDGAPEVNDAVKTYITNYTADKSPYPSDRFRCILPVGGNSGNGAGDYYIKIGSVTKHANFFNCDYKIYIFTNKKNMFVNMPEMESEPNGGGDCGENSTTIHLVRDMVAKVDAQGCLTDEFKLTLTANDFNATDTLFISLNNIIGNKGYSDHRIYGIWNNSKGADVVSQMKYQTYTNFNNMPSGMGKMDGSFFKPNNSNTSIDGEINYPYFYYDYDNLKTATKNALIDWTKWNWDVLGVRGLRMDAVKHFEPKFVGDMLNAMHSAGKDPSLVVGEWYGDNTTELKGWVNDVQNNMTQATKDAIKVQIFDFSLRENLRKTCDEDNFDARNIFVGSLRDQGLSGFNVVTFVNNHDFRDMSGFASLIRKNPNLGYAYILTNNQLGLPTVFYPDYYGYPAKQREKYQYHPTNLPAYKTEIDKLMGVLKNNISGSPSVDYLNRMGTPYSSSFIEGSSNKALIYQLRGPLKGGWRRDVIVAINFGTTRLKVDHGINTYNGIIKKDTKFTDVLKRSAHAYAQVDENNQIFIDLPAKSYSVWVQSVPADKITMPPVQMGIFNVKVSPNPVTNGTLTLEINTEDTKTLSVKILSAGRQPLYQQTINPTGTTGRYTVPVSGLISGTYTVVVSNGTAEVSAQFVKQ